MVLFIGRQGLERSALIWPLLLARYLPLGLPLLAVLRPAVLLVLRPAALRPAGPTGSGGRWVTAWLTTASSIVAAAATRVSPMAAALRSVTLAPPVHGAIGP